MPSSLEHHHRSIFPRSALVLAAAVTVCASCAAPRRQPLDDAALAGSVQTRAGSVADLETALALADLGPLAVPVPSGATTSPADHGFWQTCAYLYEPGVRQARRKLEAKRALARGAGSVQSFGAGVEDIRGGSDYETDVMATVDLLALLGLGPSRAAKELACAEVREAFGNLEAAVWAARFRVERALVRLDGAMRRVAIADRITEEAKADEARIDELARTGRGSTAEIAWARATLRAIEGARAQASVDEARAREELTIATGVVGDHPALRALEPPILGAASTPIRERPVPPMKSSDTCLLLGRIPALRAAKLGYAVAEARVRSAAAATWPSIEIGPKLRFIPDDFLAGGILDLSVPLPAAARAAICAALVERAAARDAVEDALVRARARIDSLYRQLFTFREAWQSSSLPRREASIEMWEAARARFRSDPAALGGWSLAIEMRVEAEMALISAEESEQLARIDLDEETGLKPEGRTLDDDWEERLKDSLMKQKGEYLERARRPAETRPQ